MKQGTDLARDLAGESIRQGLIEGRWPPGSVLQEHDLANSLGLSKTPIREALLRLSFGGLVRPVPRFGYVVADIGLEDLIEVFELRMLIEGDAVASVAEVPVAIPEQGQVAERDFHLLLFRPVLGRRRMALLSDLLDETARSIRYLGMPSRLLTELGTDHLAIADAIANRDSVLARSLLVVHLARLRESLLAPLRQRLREQNRLI